MGYILFLGLNEIIKKLLKRMKMETCDPFKTKLEKGPEKRDEAVQSQNLEGMKKFIFETKT